MGVKGRGENSKGREGSAHRALGKARPRQKFSAGNRRRGENQNPEGKGSVRDCATGWSQGRKDKNLEEQTSREDKKGKEHEKEEMHKS